METRSNYLVPEIQQQQNQQFFSITDLSFTENQPTNLSPPKYHQFFHELLSGTYPKKTQNLVWQSRFFSLTPFRLIYFYDETRSQIKGCFNIASLLKYNIHLQSDYPILKLVIFINDNHFLTQFQLIKLLIQDRKQFMKWRDTISSLIQALSLSINQLSTAITDNYFPLISERQIINKNSRFWNKITISMKQFQCYANHLDILLFRSSHNLSNFQRFLMGSYYNHVGIILRDQMNRIYVLQALQSWGVWVRQWQQFKPILRQSYQSIGYRKVVYPQSKLNDENCSMSFEKLQEQLNFVLGKRYQLNLNKLLPSADNSQMVNQQQTYFCSSLVGSLYLKMGLLKNRKCNEFWPKDFQKQLKLEKGAHLSPLYELQF